MTGISLAPAPKELVFHLEELKHCDAAAAAYERCIELDPNHADAHFNLARLSEIRGDKQGLVRHLSAYRRLSG